MTIRVAPNELLAARADALRKLAEAVEHGKGIDGADVDLAIDALMSYRPQNVRMLRKLTFQRLRHKLYPLATVSAAAELIVQDWKGMRRQGFIEPGSREEFFQRLEALGLQLPSKSTVIRYLDPDY